MTGPRVQTNALVFVLSTAWMMLPRGEVVNEDGKIFRPLFVLPRRYRHVTVQSEPHRLEGTVRASQDVPVSVRRSE